MFGHFELGSEAEQLWTEANEPGRRALSDVMMSYWAEFAATGSPGRGRAGDLAEWKPWNGGRLELGAPGSMMVLDTPEEGGPRMVSEPVTAAAVMRELAADEHFADETERCAMVAELEAWFPRVAAARTDPGVQLACAGDAGTVGGE